MIARWNVWRLVALLAMTALYGVGSTAAHAQNNEGAASEEPAAEAPAEDDAKADAFAVPETDDVAKLLEFIEGVRAARPPRPRDAQSYRKYVKYNQKAGPAIEQAANKILSLEKDKTSDAYKAANNYLLASKLRGIMEAGDEDREKQFDALLVQLKESTLGLEEAGLAFQLANSLEYKDAKLGKRAYEELGAIIEKSEDEQVRALAPHFQGAARRLNMLGNKLEVLTGTTLEGTEFDWNSYRGKVVLVDFWATWCGPCVAEIPNVKAAYEKYHDKGFDVVGISLDRKREDLDAFLKRESLPWTQLFQAEGRNKMAEMYGVNAIPTVILVDREGKVVSMSARGRELDRLLAEIFPDASDAQ